MSFLPQSRTFVILAAMAWTPLVAANMPDMSCVQKKHGDKCVSRHVPDGVCVTRLCNRYSSYDDAELYMECHNCLDANSAVAIQAVVNGPGPKMGMVVGRARFEEQLLALKAEDEKQRAAADAAQKRRWLLSGGAAMLLSALGTALVQRRLLRRPGAPKSGNVDPAAPVKQP